MKPEQVVFAVATTDQREPVVFIGLHDLAIEQLKAGNSQQINLAPLGILVMLGYEKTQRAVLDVLAKAGDQGAREKLLETFHTTDSLVHEVLTETLDALRLPQPWPPGLAGPLARKIERTLERRKAGAL